MSGVTRHLIALAAAFVIGGLAGLVMWFAGVEFRIAAGIAIITAAIAETIAFAVLKRKNNK